MIIGTWSTQYIVGNWGYYGVFDFVAEKPDIKGMKKRKEPELSDVPAETILIRDWPEAIISLEDAQRYGLTIYRTGQPCVTGRHTGYRSVYSGTCIACN